MLPNVIPTELFNEAKEVLCIIRVTNAVVVSGAVRVLPTGTVDYLERPTELKEVVLTLTLCRPDQIFGQNAR